MAAPFILIIPLLALVPSTLSQLTPNYYEKTCPRFLETVGEIVTEKQIESPSTAAAALRLFFHDCSVEGCDASILISSNSLNSSERDADINHSLPGDGFDVVVRVKAALELQCPGIVSCADVLAIATRNLVVMTGGPYYRIDFGRKDAFISNPSPVDLHLATAKVPVTKIIEIFQSKGFNVQEMVALLGGHTIGFSHCKEFSERLFNFSSPTGYDPAYNPRFAQQLRTLCANYTTNPDMSAFNDVITPGKFDNMYYRNLHRGLGLLATDHAVAVDPRTRPFVDMYAANQTRFFEDFARAMEKLSVYNIKTGKDGEVRRKCHTFNHIKTQR